MDKLIHILSFLSRYRYIAVIVTAVVFLGFLGENSYLSHLRNQHTMEQIRSEIADYEKQYEESSEKLNQMDSNLVAVKQVARERYYMKQANEDVFIIED